MEIFIAVLVTINIAATLVLTLALRKVGSVITSSVPEDLPDISDMLAFIQGVFPAGAEIEQEPVNTIAVNTAPVPPADSSSPWVNRTGIEWDETNKRPAEPPAKRPDGYGFVR